MKIADKELSFMMLDMYSYVCVCVCVCEWTIGRVDSAKVIGSHASLLIHRRQLAAHRI